MLAHIIAIVTKDLDDLIQQDEAKKISSHEELKIKALKILSGIIETAPQTEYKNILNDRMQEVFLGYLLNVLCRLARGDKSKNVRVLSLEIVISLVENLNKLKNICPNSLSIVVSSLPGVSSTLYKLIISDTKLPSVLIATAIRCLTRLIVIALNSPQLLKSEETATDNLQNICDNLALRTKFFIGYIMNNYEYLPAEVLYETLIFCENLALRSNTQLLSKTLNTLVRFVAFASFMTESTVRFEQSTNHAKLKLMLIFDYIKTKEGLEPSILSSFNRSLDNLHDNCLNMLLTERQSELITLSGLLELMSGDILTSFMEVKEKRQKLFGIFIRLTELDSAQPFLLITDSPFDEKALEEFGRKMYTSEKKFTHLNHQELAVISKCCYYIGKNLDHSFLNDIITSELIDFSQSNNLFTAHLVLHGYAERDFVPSSKFASQLLGFYTEHIHEQYLLLRSSPSGNEQIMRISIAIETITTIIKLYFASKPNENQRAIILMDLLCLLLNWCSSTCSAISETTLNVLSQLSQLYDKRSIREFLEDNIDYIVNGVSLSLNNFACNPDIVHVLATAFKLTSIDKFYYFKDVYDNVFNLLHTFSHTKRSKDIALLFFRTLTTIRHWQSEKIDPLDEDLPLQNKASVENVIRSIDIDSRINKLRTFGPEAEAINKKMEAMQVTKTDEKRVLGEINDNTPTNPPETVDEKQVQNAKPMHIALTETIIKHCVGLISSNYSETKILALQAATCGLELLRDDEDTLLPLVHQLWPPLLSRLTRDYDQNLEVTLSAFECLVSMAFHSKDFIKRRTLDTILPRMCLFLESQASLSKSRKDYDPYCMTIAYKCQLRVLSRIGQLAYNIQLAYNCLWRVVKSTLIYLDKNQPPALYHAARTSLHYLITLDPDCVWYFAKQAKKTMELPFERIFDSQ